MKRHNLCLKILIMSKKPCWSKFGNMSELRPRHSVHFSLSVGKNQTDFNHTETDSKNYFVPKIEQNLQKQGKYLENEDAYSSLHSKLVMFL
jgi:hypothetical protein